MRFLKFSERVAKEIIRDPLTVAIGLGFPLAVMIILAQFQKVAGEMFSMANLEPGIAVFGSSFMTLFTANLIAKDRSSAFLNRLFSTPMSASDFIIGYALPVIPIAVCQHIICLLAAFALGLEFSAYTLLSLVFMLPTEILFISLGLLFGSIFNEKQVGGICGALLTNITVWTSGAFFPADLTGGAFKAIIHILPFYHAVEAQRLILAGNPSDTALHIAAVMLYVVFAAVAAVSCFRMKMKA